MSDVIDAEEEWKEFLAVTMVVIVLVVCCIFIAKHYTDEKWQKKVIERGYATYEDGKFTWLDEKVENE